VPSARCRDLLAEPAHDLRPFGAGQPVTGGPAVYACDSCGSLAQMQSIAQLRLTWAVPLTQARDDPPSADAFS